MCLLCPQGMDHLLQPVPARWQGPNTHCWVAAAVLLGCASGKGQGMVWECLYSPRFRHNSENTPPRPKRYTHSFCRKEACGAPNVALVSLSPTGVLSASPKGLELVSELMLLWELRSQQMLYSEREHPLKTIWCLLINKNSVFGVLRQEERRKAHVGLASWVKTCRLPLLAALKSRFLIALVCQHLAFNSSDIWQDSMCLCWDRVPWEAASHSPALWCCPVAVWIR